MLLLFVRLSLRTDLLGEVGGHHYQAALWRLLDSNRILLCDLTPSETRRMAELMKKYGDVPMDMADASLLAVAESRSLRQVFTLDTGFRIFRLKNGRALELLP